MRAVTDTVAWDAALHIARQLTALAPPVRDDPPSPDNPCFSMPDFRAVGLGGCWGLGRLRGGLYVPAQTIPNQAKLEEHRQRLRGTRGLAAGFGRG